MTDHRCLLDDITRLFSLLATVALAVGDVDLCEIYVENAGNVIRCYRDQLGASPPDQQPEMN